MEQRNVHEFKLLSGLKILYLFINLTFLDSPFPLGEGGRERERERERRERTRELTEGASRRSALPRDSHKISVTQCAR